MSIVSAVVLCTLVGAVGAIILVAASKFMAVEEDPRIEEVAGCLAGANCGGCGYAGCADYAKAVVMELIENFRFLSGVLNRTRMFPL